MAGRGPCMVVGGHVWGLVAGGCGCKGACMVAGDGGMHFCRGGAWLLGVCMVTGGVCMVVGRGVHSVAISVKC